MGSLVTEIIAMSITFHHQFYQTYPKKSMIYHSLAQRLYKNLQYKVEKKEKIPYWASIHKERKVSKGFHPSHVNEVMWLRDVQTYE
jgi:hypothetical protein